MRFAIGLVCMLEDELLMISVVIPVFNTVDYLSTCIDSVLKQTYKDFEIVLVDDGSTDGSEKVCDEYCKKDARIKTIHQVNKGLVNARKTGVTEAKGQFISFIDSDDWVESDYLEMMFLPFQKNLNSKIDLVAGLHIAETEDESILIKRTAVCGLYDKKRIFEEVLPQYFWNYKFGRPCISASVCTKLFRKEVLIQAQEIIDERITCGEDGSITFPIVMQAESIYVSDYCGYHYRKHDSSMTHELSPDIFSRIFYLRNYLMECLKKKGYDNWLENQVESYLNFFLPQAAAQLFNRDCYLIQDRRLSVDYIPLNSSIIIYGAGKRGRELYRQIGLRGQVNIVAWVDQKKPEWPLQMEIERPESIKNKKYDYVIIAVAKEKMAIEIKEKLNSLDVDQDKVLWEKDYKQKHSNYITVLPTHWKQIRQHKHVYIYGAGVYGRELFDKLIKEDIIAEAFVVTDESLSNCECRGKRVMGINEWEPLDDSIILVAVSPKIQKDIVRVLERKGYTNYELFFPLSKSDAEEIWNGYPIKNNKVFFDSFRGLGYLCNPKYIADKLLQKDDNVDVVWDITDDANLEFPKEIRTVKRDSPEFYREYYSSRVVVTNMSSVKALKKNVGQYYINTWHGTGPFKKVGKFVYDRNNDTAAYDLMKQEYEYVDLALAACDQCIVNHRQAFEYIGDIKKWGYPRNDIFFVDPKPIQQKVFKRLGIDPAKRLVLYAPTFRYSIRKGIKSISEVYNVDLMQVAQSLSDRFDTQFEVVVRFHQYIYRENDVSGYFRNFIDATLYPDMQELLVAADVLITDWSSSIWDYSLTKKPIFLYFNDSEEAEWENGFYVEPDDLPYPKGHTTDELCSAIETFNQEIYDTSVQSFLSRYNSYDDGHASERVAERIVNVIKNPESYV